MKQLGELRINLRGTEVDSEHFLSPLISLFTSYLRLRGPKISKTHPQRIFKFKQPSIVGLKVKCALEQVQASYALQSPAPTNESKGHKGYNK